ncbi:hypothetical protein [Robertkochia marina]|uniref:hypothetical protein n=1 Tax=Robertkochia marina TaxID=1227945 RepID=UPI001454C2C5|nr:hypothetical protein [Robertkochia marina]
MKRFYKILLLFVILFLLGIGAFAGYINYTLDKKEKAKAAEIEKVATTHHLNV